MCTACLQDEGHSLDCPYAGEYAKPGDSQYMRANKSKSWIEDSTLVEDLKRLNKKGRTGTEAFIKEENRQNRVKRELYKKL